MAEKKLRDWKLTPEVLASTITAVHDIRGYTQGLVFIPGTPSDVGITFKAASDVDLSDLSLIRKADGTDIAEFTGRRNQWNEIEPRMMFGAFIRAEFDGAVIGTLKWFFKA